MYDLLFRAAAATLLQVAANPKRLGAAIGGLMVLHTWGQRLQHHSHVHCVVPAGGLSPDGAQWIHARPTFFLPVKVLRQVFRGKLVAGLCAAFHQGRLSFPGTLQALATETAFRAWLRSLDHQPWVVSAKPPFGSPAHVLHYLARYTHRVAISNHRLVNRHRRHGLLSVEGLPARESDPYADARCPLLRLPRPALSYTRARPVSSDPRRRTNAAAEPLVTSSPRPSWPCPRCGAPMRIVERLTARQLFLEALLADCFHDTS